MQFPGNIGEMLKQAQQLQQRLKEVKQGLETKSVEASAGAGMVQVRVSGVGQLLEIKIEPDIVNPNEIQMLQDLVRAAVNEAIKKSREMMKEELSQATGGIPLPDIF